MTVPARVAILGAGTIGSGWAALFAAYGAHVIIVDPDEESLVRVERALACARELVASVGDGRIARTASVAGAVRGATWVQESLPETLDAKRRVLEEAGACAEPDAIIASSTSSFTPSALAEGAALARRFLVAHPLHPVYAVPVVELCAARATDPRTVERATEVLRAVGREPVVVRREIPGLVANRLTAALLREALDLVADDVIGAAELDAVVARGIATGWMLAGAQRTELIGAGGASAERWLEQLGEPLQALWRSLASWTSLDTSRRARWLAAMARDEVVARDADDCAWARALVRVLRAASADDATSGA
jgi:carnitine 3-dehydrogenase